MMKQINIKKFVIGVLALTLIGGAALNIVKADKNKEISSSPNQKESALGNIPYSKETDIEVVGSHAAFDKVYQSVGDLVNDADIIAKVEVIDQRTIADYEVNHDAVTISDLKVTKLIKGQIDEDGILTVLESGGIYDETKQVGLKDKPGEGQPRVVDLTIEGVPQVQVGNKYFVFLKKVNKSHFGEEYNFVGSYVQGRVKIDNNGVIVSTVNPKHVKEDPFFMLLQKFGGQTIEVLEDSVGKELGQTIKQEVQNRE